MIFPDLHLHSSLRARLLLILVLAFALLSALSFYRMTSERDERIENARNQVQRVAESIIDEQTRIVEYANRALNNLTPMMRGLATNPDCSAQLAAKAGEYPEFWNIALARVNGDVVCHARPFSRPLNIADRAYFKEVLQRSEMVIGGPVVDRVTDIPTLIFLRALRDDSGRVEGAYYVALGLSGLQSAFSKARLPEGSRLGLVDTTGQVIVRYPDPEGAVGKRRIASPAFTAILATNDGSVSDAVTPIDGVRRIFAVSIFAKTAEGSLLLYVAVPKSLVTEAIERDFTIDLALRLGMLAILTVLVWFGSNRFFLRPIATLCDAARRLGEGDFAMPPLQTRIVEVQALQRALVDSAAKLRHAFAERERFEAALQASETRLLLALESAELGSWELDLINGKAFHSPRFDQIFGHAAPHAQWSLGRVLAHIVPEDRQKVADAVAQAQAREGRMTLEVRLRQPGGAIRWVAWHGQAHFDDAGRATHIVGVVADVSEQKQAEQALQAAKDEAERANNAKSRFLAAASHDLRQPLGALALYVGVLKYKIGAQNAALADSIKSCVSSLNELLTDLLDVSKLDAGVVKPHIADFAIADVLGKLVAQYASEAHLKGVHLRYRASRFVACSDALLVTRVLGNLVANAVRYTESGAVLVACRRHQGTMWVEIWDTGVGIPADKTAEIFEEFRQLGDDARNRGSGLGLAIVAKTAALLGLSIRVASRLGKGSMFALQLPPGQARTLTPAKAPAPPGKAMRIALVEDNTRVLEAMLWSLEQAGHRVVAAVSLPELMARLGGLAPDIVISDYRLAEGETGFDVIAALRAAYGDELPAIIVTGDTDPKIIASMAGRGIQILYKPIEIEALQVSIALAMRRRASLADEPVSSVPEF